MRRAGGDRRLTLARGGRRGPRGLHRAARRRGAVLIVLKIGGSVFARDADGARVDVDCLTRLADEVTPWVGSLVLVHGAGWYPRSLLPRTIRESRLPGAAAPVVERLRGALADVAEAVDRVLAATGLPVTRLRTVDASEIEALLAGGRVPLLCGRIADEADGSFRIVSSDRIVARAARSLGASMAVWATDVDGVLASVGAASVVQTGGTAGEEGEPIDALRPDEIDRIVALESSDADGCPSSRLSTGEMRGKLAIASELARAGIPSLIVNGGVEGRVAAALAGGPVRGTRVEAVAG